MKTRIFSIIPIAAGLAVLGLTSCEVEKTQEGNLPEVKVETEGDVQLPKYDVDGPEIDAGTKKVEVEVPTVEITPASELPDDDEEENVE
jgi:hypothetical protein